MSRALYEEHVARLVLDLREALVRHDDNLAAYKLMTEAVPWFLHGHPEIEAARERQRQMCLHLIDPDAYKAYYATNIHERPFEEQYPGATVDNAHEVFHRVAFLRRGLGEQRAALDAPPRILDVSCNDGWMAANLAMAGYTCHGFDLNPDCIDRAKLRKQAFPLMGGFIAGDVLRESLTLPLSCTPRWEDMPIDFDAIVCFETIEHLPDPDGALRRYLDPVCGWLLRPGKTSRLYVSTPNGVDHGGDLPSWDHVEPKGHVRVYTPDTFLALLQRHGTVERLEQGPDGVMVAEVSP